MIYRALSFLGGDLREDSQNLGVSSHITWGKSGCVFCPVYWVHMCEVVRCNPMDRSPPGSSVHGVLQARMLEWVAMPSSGGSSWPQDHSHVSYVHCAWDSPGKNTGVGCHALLRGVFLAPGSQPRLLPPLHWQGGSLPLVPRGKPGYLFIIMFG